MRLFKRKKRSLIERSELAKVSDILDERKRKLAAYLARKTAYWNRNAKITALAFFCLLFGGACLWLIIHAIVH